MSLSFINSAGKVDTGGGNTTLNYIDVIENVSTVVGFQAGRFNDSGTLNTIIGYLAAGGNLATGGGNNVIVGTYSGLSNRGDYNTWLGSRAGEMNLEGSENVAVGYRAGWTLVDTFGNAFLGYESGTNTVGDGNTMIGYKAGSEGTTSSTDSNTAVGSYATAVGGDAMAFGAGAFVNGTNSMGFGSGTTVSAPNSVVVGNNITATSPNSLILFPRRDNAPSAHSLEEELNIYNVVTGHRESSRAYKTKIESDKLVLSSGNNNITLNPSGIEFYSDDGIAYLSPTTFASPVSITAPVSMTDAVTMTNGMRVSLGTTVFDDLVVFNDTVKFSVSNFVLEGIEADHVLAGSLTVSGEVNIPPDAIPHPVVESLTVHGTSTMFGAAEFMSPVTARDIQATNVSVDLLQVTGIASLPSNCLPHPVFETVTVHKSAKVFGHATFKSGIHVCCAPATVDSLHAHNVDTHHLNVTGDTHFTESRVVIDDLDVKEGHVETLTAELATVRSNLVVDQNLYGGGTLFYDSAFLGNVGAGSLFVTNNLTAPALQSDYIVCKTILVTGDETLTVLGTSHLNSTETNDLKVKDKTILSSVRIDSNLWVELEANVGTLVVRSGTVMTRLDCFDMRVDGNTVLNTASASVLDVDNLSASIFECPSCSLGNVAAESLAGRSVTASNLLVDTLQVSRVANAEEINVQDIEGLHAEFSNLRVGNITIDGEFDIGSISLHNSVLSGTTSANSIRVEDDSVFERDLTVQGVLRAHQLDITGGFSLNTGLPIIFDDVLIANSTVTVRGDAAFEAHVTAETIGASDISTNTLIAESDVTTKGCVIWDNPIGQSYWHACLGDVTPYAANLVFKSTHGTTFTICDDFEPGVLNFTGKHRCSIEGGVPQDNEGLIVVTTGKVRNLDGTCHPTVDEALPVVTLATKAGDRTAYGVIAGYEAAGANRRFRLASMIFSAAKSDALEAKVIVNSVGEGAMWVCDKNGRPRNGDLLETSSVMGHAQLQRGDDTVRASTVAKVVADPVEWLPMPENGCDRCLVAVVYKF